jgi:hypothetical protein
MTVYPGVHPHRTITSLIKMFNEQLGHKTIINGFIEQR